MNSAPDQRVSRGEGQHLSNKENEESGGEESDREEAGMVSRNRSIKMV